VDVLAFSESELKDGGNFVQFLVVPIWEAISVFIFKSRAHSGAPNCNKLSVNEKATIEL
jgi:hypothetical protein